MAASARRFGFLSRRVFRRGPHRQRPAVRVEPRFSLDQDRQRSSAPAFASTPRSESCLERPELCRYAPVSRNRLFEMLTDLRRDSHRTLVLWVDQRNQARRPDLSERPVTDGGRRLSRIATSPGVARERPAEFDFGSFPNLRSNAASPNGWIPGQKSNPEGCQNPGSSGCGSVVLVQETTEVVAALDGIAGR